MSWKCNSKKLYNKNTLNGIRTFCPSFILGWDLIKKIKYLIIAFHDNTNRFMCVEMPIESSDIYLYSRWFEWFILKICIIWSTPLKSSAKGNFIGIFKISTHWKTGGKTGNLLLPILIARQPFLFYHSLQKVIFSGLVSRITYVIPSRIWNEKLADFGKP